MTRALAQLRLATAVTPAAASARGCGKPIKQVGFTLVELLVVLVIIGCLVSLALFSTGRNTERELQEEARRLATVMTLLADEAVLENREYGLLINSTGYQVLSFAEDCACWSVSTDQQGYRLPEWVRLQLQLDGEPLQLGGSVDKEADGEEDEADEQSVQPQLLLLSSGELSAFSLRLEVRDLPQQAFAVSSDGFQLPAVTRVTD